MIHYTRTGRRGGRHTLAPHPARRAAAACWLLLLALAGSSPVTAAVLIGPDVGNGSFEASSTAFTPWAEQDTFPWGSAGVVTDAAFASHGQRYGRLTGAAQPSFTHSFFVDPALGRRFSLAFDARVSAARPFDGLFLVGPLSSDATPTLLDGPIGWTQNGTVLPNSATWTRYVFEWGVKETRPAGWMALDISYRASRPDFSNPYTGYLDNVVLTQTPEPSAALVSLGGLGAGALGRRRRRV